MYVHIYMNTYTYLKFKGMYMLYTLGKVISINFAEQKFYSSHLPLLPS